MAASAERGGGCSGSATSQSGSPPVVTENPPTPSRPIQRNQDKDCGTRSYTTEENVPVTIANHCDQEFGHWPEELKIEDLDFRAPEGVMAYFTGEGLWLQADRSFSEPLTIGFEYEVDVNGELKLWGGTIEVAVTAAPDAITHTIEITEPQNGIIQVAGTMCPGQCNLEIPDNQNLELRATPDEGYYFESFTSDCGGQSEDVEGAYGRYIITPVTQGCSVSANFAEVVAPQLEIVEYETSYEEGTALAPFTEYTITVNNSFGPDHRFVWFVGDGAGDLGADPTTSETFGGLILHSNQHVRVEVYLDDVLRARHTWAIAVQPSSHDPLLIHQVQFAVQPGASVEFQAQAQDFAGGAIEPVPVTQLHNAASIEWFVMHSTTNAMVGTPEVIMVPDVLTPSSTDQQSHNITTTWTLTAPADPAGYWVHCKVTLDDGTFVFGSGFLTVQ